MAVSGLCPGLQRYACTLKSVNRNQGRASRESAPVSTVPRMSDAGSARSARSARSGELAGGVELCVALAGERYDAVVNLDA